MRPAVRIGFEYVGNDGAQIALDDIYLDGTAGSAMTSRFLAKPSQLGYSTARSAPFRDRRNNPWRLFGN